MLNTPTPEERLALLDALAPLPISGPAWPSWVKTAAWVIVALIGVQIVMFAARAGQMPVDPVSAGIVALSFMGLAFVAWHMQNATTTIDAQGLRQTWLSRRDIAWDEIQYAKFVPMLLSKRLILFRKRGRPLVLQGGTQALHIAFARIAVTYRRR